MINPAITADYSYWTGQVILGNNNSGSSSYECITIPIGKTVIVDEQAELFLWGNHLIVKGALHYYHANFHFGVGGAIICDGGTVVAHGSGIVNIDDEGSGISVLAGGSYINASPGLELHFSNDAQFKNDDGYVELADDSGMIFEATSDKLEILAGAEFRLGADALIEVNSYLDAKGSPVKPITFTSLYNEPTPEQYWSYIKLIGQNPGTEPPAMIKNTVIEYGNYGLFVYNGNMTIENNLIRNNYHTNVYFYNSSGVLSDNTIRDAVQSHGVLLFDSSPEFYRNTISFNANTGIHCEYYSSPQFGYDRPGNNVITNNKYGLFARNYSNPFLGHDLGSYGGYNSIYKNVDYAIGAMYNCEVVARINWWGDYPPPAELFYTDITSGIDYLPALESDPNEEMAPLFL
ncbi:MAG: right-handed parallel beta-helix repeat-containing protein, partial [Calditrichia bacterium]